MKTIRKRFDIAGVMTDRECSSCGKKLERGVVRCPSCNHRNDPTMSVNETLEYLKKAKALIDKNNEKKG